MRAFPTSPGRQLLPPWRKRLRIALNYKDGFSGALTSTSTIRHSDTTVGLTTDTTRSRPPNRSAIGFARRLPGRQLLPRRGHLSVVQRWGPVVDPIASVGQRVEGQPNRAGT